LRSALVVMQVAVCVILLVGAGLLTRALQRVQALDVGFRTAGLFLPNMICGARVIASNGARFQRRACGDGRIGNARVRSTDVTCAVTRRYSAHGGVAEGHVEQVICTTSSISRTYFDTLDIPITGGRTFSDGEDHDGSPVVIISEGLRARFWPASIR
jgi:hypothetical protein